MKSPPKNSPFYLRISIFYPSLSNLLGPPPPTSSPDHRQPNDPVQFLPPFNSPLPICVHPRHLRIDSNSPSAIIIYRDLIVFCNINAMNVRDLRLPVLVVGVLVPSDLQQLYQFQIHLRRKRVHSKCGLPDVYCSEIRYRLRFRRGRDTSYGLVTQNLAGIRYVN